VIGPPTYHAILDHMHVVIKSLQSLMVLDALSIYCSIHLVSLHRVILNHSLSNRTLLLDLRNR
jgi:hypothetical protein